MFNSCSNDCFFCEKGLFALNKAIGIPSEESVVYEDEFIFVTPDIAPICLGHFLIISKRHLNSFGNSCDATWESVKKATKYIQENFYKSKDSLLFEHGAVIPGAAGACIDHAHIHIIPDIDVLNIDEYIKKSCLVSSEKVSANFHKLLGYATNNQPYLFYSSAIRGSWVYPVQQLPHQFFRMIVSHYTHTQYNWKFSYESNSAKKLFMQTLFLHDS